MALKLFIKQTQQKDKHGAARHVQLDGDKLVYKPGNVPPHRQMSCYPDFADVTTHVSNLYKLKLTWTQERSAEGLPSTGPSNQKKAASGSISFEGLAYQYIRQWLVDDESAVLNTLEVRITDENVGHYLGWEIRATDVSWCDGDICTIEAGLKQQEEAMTCIKNTWIADNDNELKWFGDTYRPVKGKMHPRFSYCNEVRPNGMLIALWWTMTQLMSILGPTILLIANIVNPTIFHIVAVLKIINKAIKFINNNLGGNINTLDDEIKKLEELKIEPKDIKDIFGNFFLESGGCGREHPAPLIRDYITNVCSKCDVYVGPDTAPVFFADRYTIETYEDWKEKRGPQEHDNPYVSACYFNGVADKGIRRYDNLNIFSGATKNLTDWWLPGNAPLLTLNEFLDKLKPVFNAEWRVENGKLYFQRKDYWLENEYVFDFSKGGKDEPLLLTGICYEWDEAKSPVYAKGIYNSDAADVCGNNAQNHMNGYASFGNIDENPTLDGVMDKTAQFGATKFRLDGASTDYLYDAMQQVINTTLITGSVWTSPLFSTVNGFFRDYANYALLLKQETATLPKILIWDGRSYENAKCVQPYHASVSLSQPTPPINEDYNSFRQLWEHRHEPQTSVSGRKMVPGSQPQGIYEVLGIFGTLVTRQAAKLVNYPMYFEPGYKGNLWDWFHWIDDPTRNPKRHQRFTAKIKLCPDTLNAIRPFGHADGIVLGQKVKLPLPYIQDGRITEIEISYDVTNEYGPHIQLRGTV